MKSKFLLITVLVAGLLVVNFSVSRVYGQTPQNKTIKQDTLKYTCPMHPDVIKANPGKCPKCGMALVIKKDKSKWNKPQAYDSTMMKHDHKKMMHDSTTMKKDKMMKDSSTIVTNKKGM